MYYSKSLQFLFCLFVSVVVTAIFLPKTDIKTTDGLCLWIASHAVFTVLGHLLLKVSLVPVEDLDAFEEPYKTLLRPLFPDDLLPIFLGYLNG